MKALSLRQPWAWLVTHGPSPGVPWKPVENREWQIDKNHFGPTLIHASSGMTRKEYDDCLEFCEALWKDGLRPARFPAFEELERGGIVGEVEIIGYIRRGGKNVTKVGDLTFIDEFSWRFEKPQDLIPFQNSPWFFGTVGICLEHCRPIDFIQCKGMLGFFNVRSKI